MSSGESFWEESEQVERFAAREPDFRLTALAAGWPAPSAVSVLDLGCAAGRNTVFLAQRGCDVRAVDSSRAMVDRTRSRLAAIRGAEEAGRRVRVGPMDDLGWASSGSFDLIVALGILHCAQTVQEWDRTVTESARVLKPGGLFLVSAFTPETDLTGQGLRPISGEPDLYEGFPGGRRTCLLDAPSLDERLARHGFLVVEPTQTVRRADGTSRRVSANGLYLRRPGDGDGA